MTFHRKMNRMMTHRTRINSGNTGRDTITTDHYHCVDEERNSWYQCMSKSSPTRIWEQRRDWSHFWTDSMVSAFMSCQIGLRPGDVSKF